MHATLYSYFFYHKNLTLAYTITKIESQRYDVAYELLNIGPIRQ